MEIGEQRAHHPEFKARKDKDFSLAAAWRHLARFRGSLFQRPYSGGSDGHDSPPGMQRMINRRSRFRRNGVGLTMQLVIFHPVFPYRLESSQPHMQRNFCGFDAPRLHASQNFLREVEACRGRSHRALFPGIDSLIALPVRWIVGPVNIRRKRHMANAFNHGKEIWTGSKPDIALSEVAAGYDFRLQLVMLSEEQTFTHADFSSGADQALPFIGFWRELAGQENFDASTQEISRGGICRAEWLRLDPTPAAIQPGGKDAGVVEHHQVIGSQQVRKIPELQVSQLRLAAIQVQQARPCPVGRGLLSNEFLGK